MSEAPGIPLDAIKRLVRRCEAASLAMIEIEAGGAKLRLVMDNGARAGAAVPASGLAASPDAVRSPSVGRLRLAHPHGGFPVPAPGDAVAAGDVVAFVEAGGLLTPVLAPRSGRLGMPLEADGAAVDYDRPLFA